MVTRDFTIRVNEPLVITTTSLPDGMTGDPYSAILTASGGFAPYTWTAVWLPAGRVLDRSGGETSGTFTGTYNNYMVVTVQDYASPGQAPTTSLHLRIVGRLTITTYARVLSWDGSARPDYVYDPLVSGAN